MRLFPLTFVGAGRLRLSLDSALLPAGQRRHCAMPTRGRGCGPSLGIGGESLRARRAPWPPPATAMVENPGLRCSHATIPECPGELGAFPPGTGQHVAFHQVRAG